MSELVINSQHHDALSILRALVQPWRRLTIAVDGRDNAGKSCLARYLSWQLQMPCIETDFCLASGSDQPSWDTDLLSRLLAHRHELDRPVIIEGIFVLRTLRLIDIEPDFVVNVRHPTFRGSDKWQQEFTTYESEYYPRVSNSFEVLTPVPNGF